MDLSVDASACVLRCHQQHGIALDIRWSIPRIRMNLEACCDFLSPIYVPWDFLRWMWRSYGSHSQPQNCSHVVCPAFRSSQTKKLDETSRVSFHFPVQQRQIFPRRHMRCLIDSSFGHDPCQMKAEKHITSGCFCSNMNAGTLQTYQDIVKTSRLAARPYQASFFYVTSRRQCIIDVEVGLV